MTRLVHPSRAIVDVVAIVISVQVLAACVAAAGPGRSGAGRELTIFAAASLKLPIEAAADAYEAAHPGVTIRLSLDSSAALRTQIEQGAPADLFLSADTANPERLAAAGLADGAPRPFAGNGLAIVVPNDDRSPVRTPADLAADGVELIAAGTEVPITVYADELIGRLGALPGYPDDFADRCAANIVSREDNVKAVIAKVELGEGDAGIVYRTDALASSKVDTVELPAGVEIVVTYAGVAIAGSPAIEEARSFLDWLVGPDGQAILASAGFVAAP